MPTRSLTHSRAAHHRATPTRAAVVPKSGNSDNDNAVADDGVCGRSVGIPVGTPVGTPVDFTGAAVGFDVGNVGEADGLAVLIA